MSTELARVEFSGEQVALIKRTICQGATDDELALFLAQCKRTGLDPFARQIHAVKRWDKKQSREVMAIQIGIDGFRLIGERTGEADGQEGPFWCGLDGAWRDVWLAPEYPSAAKVLVYRKGIARAFVGIAHWSEYAQTYKDGNPLPMWAQMPAGQLAKCAETLALRKAFPQELSGLYEPAEMDQAGDAVEVKAAPQHDPKALANKFAACVRGAKTLGELQGLVAHMNADAKAGLLGEIETRWLAPQVVRRKNELTDVVIEPPKTEPESIPVRAPAPTPVTAPADPAPASGPPAHGADFAAWVDETAADFADRGLCSADQVKARLMEVGAKAGLGSDWERWNKTAVETAVHRINEFEALLSRAELLAMKEELLRTRKKWTLCVEWLNTRFDADYTPQTKLWEVLKLHLAALAADLKTHPSAVQTEKAGVA